MENKKPKKQSYESDGVMNPNDPKAKADEVKKKEEANMFFNVTESSE
ncbi:hypothetical protein EV207_103209 [Scopulibacillus darangshiensis]|uniref:Uncharacterized protein n=1 Tax=Scopulibacillus darangshiensis TaxID=442528 RepID=A0A4R2PAL6_9BACL|nr:hypothetical protein [Scopulibacillus darangshiensis]TCP31324.1 hypothetical protein EV207_103209 [Scopulibacillus darangshiensis]